MERRVNAIYLNINTDDRDESKSTSAISAKYILERFYVFFENWRKWIRLERRRKKVLHTVSNGRMCQY